MITFIATAFNEEDNVNVFVNSIFRQTMLPDEIVIVDGGSADDTVSVIKKVLAKTKIKFKVITSVGNRSKGRNTAIRNASGDIIVTSDFGCILKKNWLKRITEPFRDQDVDVVAGYYLPKATSIFEKSLSTYTCIMPDRLNVDDFLPSSRSVAFKKEAWRVIGGYPEWLDTCEDLYFANQLKKKGFKFKTKKNALVYWPQRNNLKEAFHQFYNYSLGDGTARYFRRSTYLLYLRYLLGLLLIIVFYKTGKEAIFFVILLTLAGYFAWSVKKNYKYVSDRQAFFILPLLQITSDAAVLLGTTIGIVRSFFKRPRNFKPI